MNECWVLTIKTSLPNTCESYADMRTDCRVFDSFGKAKAALRETLKSLAFTRNAMFDGEGKMKYFESYIEDSWEDDEPEEDEEFRYNGCLTASRLRTLQAALTKVFAGEDISLPLLEDGDYMDGMLAMEVHTNSVQLMGWDDGPCNGYEPLIATNMFNMVKEGDYYLYLDDMFGKDDCSAELYVDLKKAEIQ
ncbi:MAG: hypothetical protein IJB36_00755 [Clostridia bacterium]|nr:hypothetical protein [Clostridia bacterium]